MKKIMILLALVAGTQLASAQKTAEACKAAVAKAKAACDDPKKAAKPATWIGLAKAGLEAYTAPRLDGDMFIGHPRQELAMLLSNAKPLSTTQETVGGEGYIVDHYATCDFYYNAAEILQFVVTTKPYIDNSLEMALEAYSKAAEVDPKASKAKDIKDGITKVATYYQTEALNYYTFGKLAESSCMFEKAADAYATAPLSVTDSSLIYNSGLTAFMAGNHERAKAKMDKCINIGYYEDGEVFAKFGESCKALGDTLSCKTALETGFTKFPNNSNIMVSLINLYIETNDDPQKLFSLLDLAKKNDPMNASLYYVEGNTRKQMGQIDEAIAAYAKCAEINPEYEFGYIGMGLLYNDLAVKYQEEAQNEFDDAKYNALVEKCDKALRDAIPPFEKAFEITKTIQTKVGIADALKNIFFRYRSEPEYQAKYDFYNEFVKNNN